MAKEFTGTEHGFRDNVVEKLEVDDGHPNLEEPSTRRGAVAALTFGLCLVSFAAAVDNTILGMFFFLVSLYKGLYLNSLS